MQHASSKIKQTAIFIHKLGISVCGLIRFPLLYRRLKLLHERGVIHSIPTFVQLAVGTVIMTKHFNMALLKSYWRDRADEIIRKRFFTDPTTMTRPLGLLSRVDSMITHMLTVDHADPRYDFDLLFGNKKGGMFTEPRQALIDRFFGELNLLIEGTHPRQDEYLATIGNPNYYHELKAYTLRYLDNPETHPIKRDDLLHNDYFLKISKIFGGARNSMAYFRTLPTTLPEAIVYYQNIRPETLLAFANTLPG